MAAYLPARWVALALVLITGICLTAQWQAKLGFERHGEQIQVGMTDAEVELILGEPGLVVGRLEIIRDNCLWQATTKEWSGPAGKILRIRFENGRVVRKGMPGTEPDKIVSASTTR